MSDLDIRDIVTLPEAALEFDRSVATFQKAIKRGALRARKVGRPTSQVWITTRMAVAEYLAAAGESRAFQRQRFEAMVKRREARQVKQAKEALRDAGYVYWGAPSVEQRQDDLEVERTG